MELKCDDVVGGLGCDYVATGDTATEVRDAMMAHGGTTHGDLMAGLSPEEAMTAKDEMETHIEQLIAAGG
jgi:predicted small metal-binding protein